MDPRLRGDDIWALPADRAVVLEWHVGVADGHAVFLGFTLGRHVARMSANVHFLTGSHMPRLFIELDEIFLNCRNGMGAS